MSKGSKRRPSLVPKKVVDDNWDRIWPKKKPKQLWEEIRDIYEEAWANAPKDYPHLFDKPKGD